MRVVALISGGKDSTYNMCKCVDAGHEIVALVNLYPKKNESATDSNRVETDSYMYQTVGVEATVSIALAMNVPLFRKEITGSTLVTENEYKPKEGDEVEDLYQILKEVKDVIDFDAVSVGAIHSTYQGKRVENICERLDIKMLAYLWGRDQVELFQEMIDYGIHAIIIKVAVIGLDKEHVGLTLKEIQPKLLQLKDKYGINVCGEGGEFETLTLDCPIFEKKLSITESTIVEHHKDPIAPVYYLNPTKIDVMDKP